MKAIEEELRGQGKGDRHDERVDHKKEKEHRTQKGQEDERYSDGATQEKMPPKPTPKQRQAKSCLEGMKAPFHGRESVSKGMTAS